MADGFSLAMTYPLEKAAPMKRTAWVTLCAGVPLAAVLVFAAAPAEKKDSSTKKQPEADNQACFVCHANYDGEELAEQHAKANVGCADCHGASTAHRNDENNITPPDRMYWAEAIDPGCVPCHGTHDAPARTVIARWQERSLAKKDVKEMVCTDCHGEHRLNRRSVRWDKRTGKLIPATASKTTTASEAKTTPGIKGTPDAKATPETKTSPEGKNPQKT